MRYFMIPLALAAVSACGQAVNPGGGGGGGTVTGCATSGTSVQKGDGAGGCTAASGTDIASGIGSAAVQNATNATTAATATTASSVPASGLPAPSSSTAGGVAAAFAASHECVVWGNSIAAGGQSGTGVTIESLIQAQLPACTSILNRGVSGQTNRQIAVRMGVLATTATVNIPATTTPATVTFPATYEPVTVGSSYGNSGQPTVNATIGGIAGVISWNGTTTVFTRNVAGTASNLTAAAMTVNVGNDLGGLNIIEGGINDRATPASVTGADAAIWAGVPQAPKRVVFLSILDVDVSTDWTGSPNGSNVANIATINNSRATNYPNNYVDIRTPMIAAYNPNLPQDVIDHNHGIVPNSLRAMRFDSVLTSNITDTTSVNFSATTGLVQAGYTYLFDQEKIYCSAVDATSTTCTAGTRGYASTTPATHTAGAPTNYWDGTHIGDPGNAIIASTTTPVIQTADPGPGANAAMLATSWTARAASPGAIGSATPAPVSASTTVLGAGQNSTPYYVLNYVTPARITSQGNYSANPTGITFSNGATATPVMTGTALTGFTMTNYGLPSTSLITATVTGGTATVPAIILVNAQQAGFVSLADGAFLNSRSLWMNGGSILMRLASGAGSAGIGPSADGQRVTIFGGLYPLTNNAVPLGSTAFRWSNLATAGLNTLGATICDSTGANCVPVAVTTGTSNASITGNWSPSTNLGYDLGRSTLAWRYGYFGQLLGVGTPSCAANATYAGTGATCAVTTGSTNMDFEITLTTGTGTAASGTLATITYATLGTQPIDCSPKPHNVNAVGQVAMVYAARPTTTTCTLSVGGSAIPASTAYVFGFHVE